MTHTVTLTGEQLAEIRSAIDSMDTWAASGVSTLYATAAEAAERGGLHGWITKR